MDSTGSLLSWLVLGSGLLIALGAIRLWPHLLGPACPVCFAPMEGR